MEDGLMIYSKESMDEICDQFRKKLLNSSDGQKDISETIVKKSKTMYIVKNRRPRGTD